MWGIFVFGLWLLPYILSKLVLLAIGFIFIIIFLAWVIAISYIRSNRIEITADFFPELYATIKDVAVELELLKVPEFYIVKSCANSDAVLSWLAVPTLFVLEDEMIKASEEFQCWSENDYWA